MRIRLSLGDRTFLAIVYLLLIAILVIVAYPLLLVLSNSFSSAEAVSKGLVWLFPVQPSFEGYAAVFQNPMIRTGYINSLIYMICGTAINLVVTIICAYPLACRDLPGRRWLLFLFMFTMYFGGGLIPGYMLVRDLNMLDTRWALLIPGAMSVWNMIVMRTYFMTSVPDELYEAATIDGCSDIRYLLRILIPLSGPILAVIGLFSAVGQWNSYFSALIYIKDKDLYPLQIVLRDILVMNNVSMDMLSKDPTGLQLRLKMINVLKYAVIVAASLPLFIVYPFVQKFFVKGVMLGSFKG